MASIGHAFKNAVDVVADTDPLSVNFMNAMQQQMGNMEAAGMMPDLTGGAGGAGSAGGAGGADGDEYMPVTVGYKLLRRKATCKATAYVLLSTSGNGQMQELSQFGGTSEQKILIVLKTCSEACRKEPNCRYFNLRRGGVEL